MIQKKKKSKGKSGSTRYSAWGIKAIQTAHIALSNAKSRLKKRVGFADDKEKDKKKNNDEDISINIENAEIESFDEIDVNATSSKDSSS